MMHYVYVLVYYFPDWTQPRATHCTRISSLRQVITRDQSAAIGHWQRGHEPDRDHSSPICVLLEIWL